MDLSRRLLILLVALTFMGVGCTEEADKIRLMEVPPPPGGTLETVTTVETDGPPRVVAASSSQLFFKHPDVEAWQPRRVGWPEATGHTDRSPLEGLGWSRDASNFPTHERLTTHRGRLWLLTRRKPSGSPMLLVSHDLGSSWSTIPLPRRYVPDDESNRRRSGAGAKLSTVEARSPLRLIDRGEAGLFLLDAKHIWRAHFSERKPVTFESWKPVDISGIDILQTSTPSALPTVVRHYLPATDRRPYELLTAFGDHLYIYRRHSRSDRWVLVSMLPSIDLSLHTSPQTDALYLLGAQAVYRLTDQGEQWTKLRLTKPLSDPPQNRVLTLLPPDTESSPRPAGPPTMLVGTNRGAIYRSDDGGDSWREARPADPDGRGISGLTVDPSSGRIWASTEGSGALVSADRGASWRPHTKNLRSTRPLALAIGLNDELVLGTRAGLFRLTGAPEDGHWDRYHDRATTSLQVVDDASRIFAGTLGGAIVTETPGGALQASKAGTLEGRAAPLFQPATAPSSIRQRSAILTVDTRPDSSSIFAWSRQQGMLASRDGGGSWKRDPLNDALLSALDRSLVTNFLVDHGERMYLTSQPFRLDAPPQLWRSFNDGETWHAVHTFRQTRAHEPLLLRRHVKHPADTLYLAHGQRLARSTDAGTTWQTVEGPWQEGTIRAYDADASDHVLLYNTRHSTRVVFAETNGGEPPTPTADYTLVWPGSFDRPHPHIRDVVAIDRFVYVTTDEGLYAGQTPEGETQLPHAPTIIATLVFILLLIGLSFWYLRTPD